MDHYTDYTIINIPLRANFFHSPPRKKEATAVHGMTNLSYYANDFYLSFPFSYLFILEKSSSHSSSGRPPTAVDTGLYKRA